MKIGLIGSGQMGNRVEEVAQERGDTVLLLRTAPKEAIQKIWAANMKVMSSASTASPEKAALAMFSKRILVSTFQAR